MVPVVAPGLAIHLVDRRPNRRVANNKHGERNEIILCMSMFERTQYHEQNKQIDLWADLFGNSLMIVSIWDCSRAQKFAVIS